ncbi:MAG: Crp/Fnr family transcriptional regulator [Gammaproteobacteria bacterium]|nr:Crp/Fnr family transcriptional regulator [Gammaproteobacteria bacterium]
MLSEPSLARFREHFASIAGDRELMRHVEAGASVASLPAGKTICNEGDACSHLALLLSGSARVFKLAESGREITLYHVEPGECCILTASCMLSGRAFPAHASVERPLDTVLIPSARVVDWAATLEVWRRFLWRLLAERLGDVIGLVDEVAFRRMDQRLVDHLVAHAARHGPELRATHGQIAAELGTSREVVSRLLKDLEQRGALRLHRGRIEVLDSAALATLSRLCD